MNRPRLAAVSAASTVLGVALAWVTIYFLNGAMFAAIEHSSRANWVFLPASVRILSVLLFGRLGAAGLVLGAFVTVPETEGSDWAYAAGLALTSGAAPLLTLAACRRLFPIHADLSGLRPASVAFLSLAGAAANAVILNGYLAISGRLHADVGQIATVFVGDALGTAIVLFILSSLLVFAVPRQR